MEKSWSIEVVRKRLDVAKFYLFDNDVKVSSFGTWPLKQHVETKHDQLRAGGKGRAVLIRVNHESVFSFWKCDWTESISILSKRRPCNLFLAFPMLITLRVD